MGKIEGWRSVYRTNSMLLYKNNRTGKQVAVCDMGRTGEEDMVLLPGGKQVKKSSRKAAINYAHKWMKEHPNG